MDKDYYTNKIREIINKIPPSINSASVDVVREYKKAVVAARKALNGRATLEKLQSSYTNLARYQ